MKSGKTRSAVALLAVAALTVGAFAGSAEAKKKKKPKPCPAYVPWEDAADATILKVTPKHTEAAPLEATLSSGPGGGLFSDPDPAGSPTDALNDHQYQNIQVDPVAKTTKVFIVAEWSTPLLDYDLYVRDTTGTAVFYAAGGNQAPAVLGDGTGHGGHSEATAEWIDGPVVLDCTGFSLDVIGTFTPGGDVTVKVWLAK